MDATTSVAATVTDARHRRRLKARDLAPYVFVSPFFILFAVFGLFPLLFSLWLAVHEWDPADGLQAMHFVGLDNFRFVVTDPWFHRAVGNTLWFALATALPQHLVALPLAAFIHERVRRGRDLIVGAYFVPYITSSVAIAMIFTTLLSRDYGAVNALLAELTRVPLMGSFMPGHPIDWLGDAHYAKPTVAFVVFWRYLGWNTVLYLSALQTISPELNEAATLDGAGAAQRFLHVTVPMLRPMIYFAVTLSIIGSLQLFEEPFILVDIEQGVSQSVMTLAIFMYRLAFGEGDFGAASAVSWLVFLLIVALTWLNARLFGREGRGES